MGRSCLGCRENISTGQIILFCSYGEMLSRLPGKVSRCDVDFVNRKFSRLAGIYISRSPRSRLSASEISVPGKTFVSHERKATFHIISYQGEISLVNLSKCFLGDRDNFCPYEQALRRVSL